jgi:dTMP kinase
LGLDEIGFFGITIFMKLGKLISFEGLEGAGKTTQVKELQKRLVKLGKEVVVLREPGGTDISEQIRAVVLGRENKEMAPTTEVLLFQAARAQIYHQVVLPSLKAGKLVLMDRTRDSSLVYQGMVRGFGTKFIEELSDYSTQQTYPDLTFLLDLPVAVSFKRIETNRHLDRIELEGVHFHESVRKAYLQVAKKNEQKRWVVVDGEQTIKEVAAAVWQRIEKQVL